MIPELREGRLDSFTQTAEQSALPTLRISRRQQQQVGLFKKQFLDFLAPIAQVGQAQTTVNGPGQRQRGVSIIRIGGRQQSTDNQAPLANKGVHPEAQQPPPPFPPQPTP